MSVRERLTTLRDPEGAWQPGDLDWLLDVAEAADVVTGLLDRHRVLALHGDLSLTKEECDALLDLWFAVRGERETG